MLRHMRTSIEISDALLTRARRVMQQRKVTLRRLVEEGLQRVLDESMKQGPVVLPDARFRGKVGFRGGAGPESITDVLREINEPRPPR